MKIPKLVIIGIAFALLGFIMYSGPGTPRPHYEKKPANARRSHEIGSVAVSPAAPSADETEDAFNRLGLSKTNAVSVSVKK